MAIYILLYFLIILFYNKLNKKNKYTWIFIGIVFTLICGLRYGIGTDYFFYSRMYNNLEYYPRTELFFSTLIKFMNKMNLSVTTFFVVVSSLTTFFYFKGVKENSNLPGFSLLLYLAMGFYCGTFNGIRQFLALSIAFCATKYLGRDNFKSNIKYLLCIFFATLCHSTAVVLFISFFFVNKNKTKKTLFIVLGICIAAKIMYNPIYNFVITHFSQYAVYSNRTIMTFSEAGAGTYLITFIHILLAIIFIINKDKLESINNMNRIYINMFVLSIFFFALGLNNAVAVRLAYYYSIYAILILPDLLKIYLGKKMTVWYVIVIIALFIYYIVYIISFNRTVPYNSIFNILRG